MLHQFGVDPQCDARWLAMLDYRQTDPEPLRRLLRLGLGPDALLGLSASHELAPATASLRRTLATVSPRGLHNGIDPEQPVWLIPLGDPHYPALLAECADAPAALFAVGRIAALQQPALAIVGARRATPLGLDITRRFATAFARAGLVVASGLALGIDAEAHRATLNAVGLTIGVSPVGVDSVYPTRHRELARDIARGGVVISEFGPGAVAHRHHFHRRNRTLSGLALGTLVIEAGCPSGSLITAAAAAQQGREVFAVPWSLGHSGGAGCLQLLAEGATLVRQPSDVLAEVVPGWSGQLQLTFDTEASAKNDAPAKVTAGERRLLKALGDAELGADRIALWTGFSVADCLALLTELELRGLVQRKQGNWRRTAA